MSVARSDFAGLWIGLRGMLAQQVGIDVTNHNVANINTPGYSRQNVNFVTTEPISLGFGQGQVGTGVDVGSVIRVRNLFLSRQMRTELSAQGEQDATKTTLQQTEDIWMGMSDSSLGVRLGEFWNSWQQLANSPDSIPVRQELVQRSADLAKLFSQTYERLSGVRRDLDRDVVSIVPEINDYAGQIAELNRRIVQVSASGAFPNDLQDRRDELLDKLSQLTNISYVEDDRGSISVSIGGRTLVTGDVVVPLTTTLNLSTGMYDVTWPDGQRLNASAGKLAAVLRLRDSTSTSDPASIPNQLANLNALASALATSVNAVHQQGAGLDGTTNLDFFTIPAGVDAAAGIAVNQTIIGNPAAIGAADASAIVPPATTPPPQDGRIAVQIRDIQYQRLLVSGTVTIDEFYRATITQLGVEVQAAKRGSETQQLLVSQLQQRTLEQSGVSIDEEATKLVSFQHAYQASARIINVVDSMLETIINLGRA